MAAVFIAVTVAAVFIGPISTVVTGTTGQQSVTNESLTADVGTFQDLEGYDVDDSETVYWYNKTSGQNETLTEGTDYEFDYTEGRIKFLSGGSVSSGEDVYVSYDYQATSATVATIGGLVPLFVVLLILVKLTNKMDI